MNRTIGLISTNYSVPGFGSVTEVRPAASIPFGGRYRLLDFALSNMVNSRIQTVGLVTPYFYRSIMDHVGAGKPWDLSRKEGGLYILPGTVFGFHEENARFLFRDLLHNLEYLRQGDGDYILVSSGTLVANIDYQPMITKHELEGKPVTLLYKKMQPGEKRPGRYLTLDGDTVAGIRRADEGENLLLDCFIVDKSFLLRMARDYAALDYMDFLDILAHVLPEVAVGCYAFDGYVAFMDGMEDYFRASLDLLDSSVRRELFQSDRPIRTKAHDTPPALYAPGSAVKNSVMTAGSIVEGSVENSVCFRNVRIEKGAVVKNCVLMEKCVVKAGARLENVVCDKIVTVSEDKIVCGTAEHPCVLAKGGVV